MLLYFSGVGTLKESENETHKKANLLKKPVLLTIHNKPIRTKKTDFIKTI